MILTLGFGDLIAKVFEGRKAAMARELPIVIRPIAMADEGQWRLLWRAYLSFYDTDLPEETYRNTFARILAGNAGMYGFIALSGHRAVGLVHYLSHPTFWKPEQTCYLQDLFTDPEARGAGVARALMQAVFTKAAQTGMSEVYWLTAETNTTARMLYDKLGVKTPFVVYERVA